MVGQLLLGLSILVILHEFGHFIAARAFGIKVEKFYLFFDAWGVSLFTFNYKGVEYGIGWLPLGGYVKIAGMIDESMDTEQMAGPPQRLLFAHPSPALIVAHRAPARDFGQRATAADAQAVRVHATHADAWAYRGFIEADGFDPHRTSVTQRA